MYRKHLPAAAKQRVYTELCTASTDQQQLTTGCTPICVQVTLTSNTSTSRSVYCTPICVLYSVQVSLTSKTSTRRSVCTELCRGNTEHVTAIPLRAGVCTPSCVHVSLANNTSKSRSVYTEMFTCNTDQQQLNKGCTPQNYR